MAQAAAAVAPGSAADRARHEVLNETNRDEIIGELISWIDRVLGSAGRA